MIINSQWDVLLSATDAAEDCGVPIDQIRDWIDSGRLPVIQGVQYSVSSGMIRLTALRQFQQAAGLLRKKAI